MRILLVTMLLLVGCEDTTYKCTSEVFPYMQSFVEKCLESGTTPQSCGYHAKATYCELIKLK